MLYSLYAFIFRGVMMYHATKQKTKLNLKWMLVFEMDVSPSKDISDMFILTK